MARLIGADAGNPTLREGEIYLTHRFGPASYSECREAALPGACRLAVPFIEQLYAMAWSLLRFQFDTYAAGTETKPKLFECPLFDVRQPAFQFFCDVNDHGKRQDWAFPAECLSQERPHN